MNAILWIVGISIASFFGLLFWIVKVNPQRRPWRGLWRDFLSTLTRDRESFPVIAHLTPPEIEALSDCGIALPARRGYIPKGANNFVIEMTLAELQSLYMRVMEASQARIARAAAKVRRGAGGGALYGSALHISILAGYLHQLMLQHHQGVERAVVPVGQTPIDRPAPAPDNPS